MTYLFLFIGGGLGTLMRHGVGRLAYAQWGATFPVGTMIINIVGSLVMGLVAGWFVQHEGVSNSLRLFLMTGVLGGFTTFSAFSLDAITLWQRHDYGMAAFYVLGSVAVSLLGLIGGLAFMRAVG